MNQKEQQVKAKQELQKREREEMQKLMDQNAQRQIIKEENYKRVITKLYPTQKCMLSSC